MEYEHYQHEHGMGHGLCRPPFARGVWRGRWGRFLLASEEILVDRRYLELR